MSAGKWMNGLIDDTANRVEFVSFLEKQEKKKKRKNRSIP